MYITVYIYVCIYIFIHIYAHVYADKNTDDADDPVSGDPQLRAVLDGRQLALKTGSGWSQLYRAVFETPWLICGAIKLKKLRFSHNVLSKPYLF